MKINLTLETKLLSPLICIVFNLMKAIKIKIQRKEYLILKLS